MIYLLENGPGLKMYFLLKIGIFQPAMLDYQRVVIFGIFVKTQVKFGASQSWVVQLIGIDRQFIGRDDS